MAIIFVLGWLFLTRFRAGVRLMAVGGNAEAVRRVIGQLDAHLEEPLLDCLARDTHGAPCLQAASPVDVETSLAMPGGHIFHGDLAWPVARTAEEVGTWGVETVHDRVLLGGAGARRGGGVSGIPGRSAAMAVLAATGQARA